MSADRLIVRGAREHNLKNVSLDLPRNAMIVFTGLSGSGKSSLAFDTIFAEGLLRSMTIFVFSSPELESHIAQSVEKRLQNRPHKILLTRF